ncbi:MAG: hypothetical protein M0D57_11600 [Sphingobacteriales bacterium JAD_PAG50586_3]|nr:MAG: hypothetical protein M0D57_11600 [Sphingobacteriales bacterium JAD_PAG50586_3]
MKFYLNNSVELDSAIVWPTHLEGHKLYNFVPTKETNPFKWLLAKISGAYTKELTDEVKALFNEN